MLTIDANVWIAASDRNDFFFVESRNFLTEIVRPRLRIYLPEFARVEIACAIARGRQNAALGERVADRLLDSPYVVTVQWTHHS